jgi:GNAT superfamily N-acetyltransferase
MENCSVCKKLQVVPGDIEDYKALGDYHYRQTSRGPFTAIFALRPTGGLLAASGIKTVGVIVYRMPSPALELRNIATGGLFTGFDRATQLALVNKNIRCISRVIVDPRFRSLGLAKRLVRETMPKVDAPIIEALAVMGLVNPFFEKAGMKPYTAPLPARCAELIEALSLVGIEQHQVIDPAYMHGRVCELTWPKADFIEGRIRRFLQSYGRRRDMAPGLERTKYVLSKLTDRPVYYIWFNPEKTASEGSRKAGSQTGG